MKVLLTSAYWPNLHYFFYVLNSETTYIEQFENYQKQSFRNRTQILTANGPLDLLIPVKKKQHKDLIKDIELCYQENWQVKHWRAITSAYKNSPYFDFFEEEIHYFYSGRFDSLFDYNMKQLELVLKLLRRSKVITLTTAFEKDSRPGIIDLRTIIHPKAQFTDDHRVKTTFENSYYQTFEGKFNFHPNLSILDLLFNEGLQAVDYLLNRAQN